MAIDIGIISILCAFGIFGFAMGLWSQLISIISVIISCFITYYYNKPLSAWIIENISMNDLSALILGFAIPIILFVVSYYLIAGLLNIIKRAILNVLELQISDRIFGLISGVFLGSIIILLLVVVLEWFSYKLRYELKAPSENKTKYLNLITQQTTESFLYVKYKNIVIFLENSYVFKFLPKGLTKENSDD